MRGRVTDAEKRNAKNARVGKVVLIGDSYFATNQNLEYVGGWPIEGKRENADFWRWLLADLTDGDKWLPKPPPPPEPPAPEPGPEDDGPDAAGGADGEVTP